MGCRVRALRDREEAADALQDGFVRAFRAASDYRGDAEVATWLGRIVLNVCLDRVALRRRRVVTVPLDAQGEDRHLIDARDAFAAADGRRAAAELLAGLPEQQRLALVLVHVAGLSVEEAARTLGVAEGTVKSRCARGRARIAAALVPARGVDDVPEVMGSD